jgi:hypothetical protein
VRRLTSRIPIPAEHAVRRVIRRPPSNARRDLRRGISLDQFLSRLYSVSGPRRPPQGRGVGPADPRVAPATAHDGRIAATVDRLARELSVDMELSLDDLHRYLKGAGLGPAAPSRASFAASGPAYGQSLSPAPMSSKVLTGLVAHRAQRHGHGDKWKDRHTWTSRDQMTNAASPCIGSCNPRRRHSALDYLRPFRL